VRLRQTGLYVQDHIGIGALNITLNGRYDRAKLRNFGFGEPRTNQEKFTYRVGANYMFESGFAPYVSYATSFEPVLGRSVDTEPPITPEGGDLFDPTEGRQVEAGVKYNGANLPSDVRIFATAAMFDIRQSNVVTAASTSQMPSGATQVGKIDVWGGEAEVVARIRDQWTINGSYSYTKTTIRESNDPAQIGADLPVTPRHKASLFVDYTFQRGPIAGLGFGFGGRYTSRTAGSIPPATVFYAGKATLFDAIVHYDLPGWRLAINGSNIFDKEYLARCESLVNCNFGAGRQVIATLTKRF
jgi:iron complex outermembrane receptor protein